MPRYKGFLVEVIDTGRGVLRWKRFVRTEPEARRIREEVYRVHGDARLVRITRFNQSTLPTRTTDTSTDRWWEGLSRHEVEDLTQGRERLP